MKEIQPLSVFIVDDEPECIRLLELLIEGIEGLSVVATATQPEKALSLYLKTHPDIIFLDVQLGNMTGLNVLNELHEHNQFPIVVFTTAFEKYALPAIRAGAFDYLLKPIDRNDLINVILKIRNNLQSHALESRITSLEKVVKNHVKLRFNTRSGLILIHPDDIFYIESSANYAEIHFSLQKREVVSMNIGALEEMLPDQFIRISRFHIINSTWLTKLSGVHKKCTLTKDGHEISLPIPEKQMPEIKRRFE